MVVTDRPGVMLTGSGSGVLRPGRPPAQLRSPSNGHNNHRSQAVDSESDSSSSGDGKNVVRVGRDYQAVVPKIETVKPKPAPPNLPEHAVLVWSPYNHLDEKELDKYLTIAKDKYNYNMEQALGMLCWHKYDIKKAELDLPNFTPFPDEWSVEDKVLFEQAFQFHDKHFHKIKQMLPDKAMASLVKYYYSWKKTRSRTSLMDRQARRLKEDQKDDASDAASDADGSDGIGDTDEKGDIIDPRVDGKPRCQNCCTTATGQFHNTNKGMLCNACYSFWRRTGTMKSSSSKKVETGPSTSTVTSSPVNRSKLLRKPPRGMFIDKVQLEELAQGSSEQGNIILRGLDQEIVSLKRQVQNNKQIISQTKHKITQEIQEDLQGIPDTTSQRAVPRWTKEEELLAVQALRKYGKDFQAVAEIVGNKSEQHVKVFYVNNERRYHLDKIIEEYNADNRREGEENKEPPSTHNRRHSVKS